MRSMGTTMDWTVKDNMINGLLLCETFTSRRRRHTQRRIFIFGALGYFKLGALLEGSRRLMSYNLAIHVLAIFTEKVVPVHNHITLF